MAPRDWEKKDLLGLEGLSASEIESILDLAASFKASPPADLLKGRTVAFIFTEPSTRTRSSFEMAAKRLGADVLSFSPVGSSGRASARRRNFGPRSTACAVIVVSN